MQACFRRHANQCTLRIFIRHHSRLAIGNGWPCCESHVRPRGNALPTHDRSGLTNALQLPLSLKNKKISSVSERITKCIRFKVYCGRIAFHVTTFVSFSMTAKMATPALCKQIDDTFGPYAGDCRGGFDFTLLFQDSILSLLPLGLLLIIVPFRITYLFRRTIKVDPSSWLASKLVSGSTQQSMLLSTRQ